MANSRNSYITCLQPFVVRLSDIDGLPDDVRGKYMLNFNMVGIRYFMEHFLLVQDDDSGNLMYMMTNSGSAISIAEDGGDVIDIPRIYIKLTDALLESQNAFRNWFMKAVVDNTIIFSGTDDFKPGADYWINYTLTNWIQNEYDVSNVDFTNISLPNYLDPEFQITKWFNQNDEALSSWTDIKYFYNRNKIMDMEYSEDEIYNLGQTFFRNIYNMSMISDELKSTVPNMQYDITIKWFKDGKINDTIVNMMSILGNKVANNAISYNCGCTGQSPTYNILSDPTASSCANIYKNAMSEYAKAMLSSVQFYKDWAFIEDVDGKLVPNIPLIDSQIKLLEQALEMDFDFDTQSSQQVYGKCCDLLALQAKKEATHQYVSKYIELLKMMLDGCLDDISNRVMVYGGKIADIVTNI